MPLTDETKEAHTMNVRITETWDQYLKRRYPKLADEVDHLMSLELPQGFLDQIDNQMRIETEDSHEG